MDIAIPCNNASVNSIGLMWWFLAREMLQLRGTIDRRVPWEIMPDLYFYRDPEDVEREEEEAAKAATAEAPVATGYEQWDQAGATAAPEEAIPVTADWEAQQAAAAIVPQGVAFSAAPQQVAPAAEQWGGAATTGDWHAGGF